MVTCPPATGRAAGGHLCDAPPTKALHNARAAVPSRSSGSAGRRLREAGADAPPEDDTCLVSTCYSNNKPTECPFTTYTPSQWSGADGSVAARSATAALTANWDAFTASTRTFVVGTDSGNQLRFPDPASLQCFLRLQSGEYTSIGKLPLKADTVFRSALSGSNGGGVCSNRDAATYNYGAWAAAALALQLNDALSQVRLACPPWPWISHAAPLWCSGCCGCCGCCGCYG
jgi:hypothetical protein